MRWNDYGERFLLSRIGFSGGSDTGIDIDLALFTNDYIFDNDSFDLASFDEVETLFALWYSREEVFSWNSPGTSGGVSSMTASSVVTWVSDGSDSTVVYGYLFLEHGTDNVLSGEKFTLPVSMAVVGSAINILPTITLKDSED